MLLETMIAAVILVLALTATFGLLDTSLLASTTTRGREGATNLARELLEDARTVPYAQLAPSSVTAQLQAMNGMADSSAAAGWQVSRRGVTYTVTATECAIDDPKDGYGVHDGTFCADSSTTGTADIQPADLKRITTMVSWTSRGTTHTVQQVSTITAAAGAIGLSASGLTLSAPIVSAPTAPVITSALTTSLTFSVTAPAATTALTWSLDGTTQNPAPALSSGTTWTFSWPITGLSDGTYQVAVQATDATGVYGPPVSIPVTLLRGFPAAPTGIRGGFNTVNTGGVATRAAELQWHANSERNVIGYRVYNPSAQLVCPASSATVSLAVSCVDFNPPASNALNLIYSVVALYRDVNGVVQQGTAAPFTLIGGSPPPAGPNPPSALSTTHNADGSVTLNWTVPSGGTAVQFYRIYRGSTDYTSRYDVTPLGTTTSYVDTDAVSTHQYWITAVSANLTESAFLGPVSG